MLALIYDVHGNLPALEAVLADAETAGADRWLLGGDYVAWGGWPTETYERLRAIDGAQWIRGNTDRWLAEPPDDQATAAALAVAVREIGPGAVEDLVALPERLTLAEGHFCHASPLNDMESFGVEPQDGDDRLLDGVQGRRVVFGHTHVQFRRVRDDGIELVNPGSVGLPLDGDHRAAYALIDDDGAVQLRRAAYDHEAAAAKIGALMGDLEAAGTFADRVRNAHL
jgi:diadenosine tetraphosphatase ApaH/serine/threonine PP2A family protein phosphatase